MTRIRIGSDVPYVGSPGNALQLLGDATNIELDIVRSSLYDHALGISKDLGRREVMVPICDVSFTSEGRELMDRLRDEFLEAEKQNRVFVVDSVGSDPVVRITEPKRTKAEDSKARGYQPPGFRLQEKEV